MISNNAGMVVPGMEGVMNTPAFFAGNIFKTFTGFSASMTVVRLSAILLTTMLTECFLTIRFFMRPCTMVPLAS